MKDIVNRVMNYITDQIEEDIADQVKDRIAESIADTDQILTPIPCGSFDSAIRKFSIGEAERIYLIVYTRLVDAHKIPERKEWWRRLGMMLHRVCLRRMIKWWRFKNEDVRHGYRDSGEIVEICAQVLNGIEWGRWILYEIAAEYIRKYPLTGYSNEMQARVYSIALHARVIGELMAEYGEYVYEKAGTWGNRDILPEMIYMGIGNYLLGTIYQFNENKEYKENGCGKTAYQILKEEGLEIEMKKGEELSQFGYWDTIT